MYSAYHYPASRCHPSYLSAKAHASLSKPAAFDGLRLHTDEVNEVIARLEQERHRLQS